MELYAPYDAPKFRVSPGEAEMVKYCDNIFHALKITFANEIGAIADSAGIDARRVAEVFCAEHKAEYQSSLSKTGIRVRWLLPSKGSASGSCGTQLCSRFRRLS